MNPKWIEDKPENLNSLATTAVAMLICRKLGDPGSKEFLNEVRAMADEDENLENIIFELGLRVLVESLGG